MGTSFQKSVVEKMIENKKNYQYNVPTAYQMFPLLQQNPIIQGLFANMQAPQMQYGQGMDMGNQKLFGASRFLNGGLLNSTSTTGT